MIIISEKGTKFDLRKNCILRSGILFGDDYFFSEKAIINFEFDAGEILSVPAPGLNLVILKDKQIVYQGIISKIKQES